MSLLLSGTLLVGCQSNPKPPPLERTATSTSPSPSPADPPTMPPEAKGTSKAAAKAFVRYWIEVLNYAGPAGDTEKLREMSDPGCAECSGIADFIEQVNGEGGDIEGKGWLVRNVTLLSFERGKRAVVNVEVEVQPQKVWVSSETKIKRFPGGTRSKMFWLQAASDSWIVGRLDQPR